jgi:hypothetical protein
MLRRIRRDTVGEWMTPPAKIIFLALLIEALTRVNAKWIPTRRYWENAVL